MTVLLRRSNDISDIPANTPWVSIMAAPPDQLDWTHVLEDVPVALERAFNACGDEWIQIAQSLRSNPSARLAHAATCNNSPSDFGATIAWSVLIDQLAERRETILATCDDPWIFRELMPKRNVIAGSPPGLLLRQIQMALRGYAARIKVALAFGWSRWRLRSSRNNVRFSAPAMLVYGHPSSTKEGTDAYFGNLSDKIEDLQRVMHTDCHPDQAAEFTAAGDVALHAWGDYRFLWSLPFHKWRSLRSETAGAFGWLIKRVASVEGAGGGGAKTAWQMHCQRNWLEAARPKAVTWPWESHPWERALVDEARRHGVRTVGYQHTTVGRHAWNLSPDSSPTDHDETPDIVMSNSTFHARDLIARGVFADRIRVGGSLRFVFDRAPRYNPSGPVFVALPSDLSAARQLCDSVTRLASGSRRWMFDIKPHPHYPLTIKRHPRVRLTEFGLLDHSGVSAVIYCASSVGLESILHGVPTLRFLPIGKPTVDVLPAELPVTAVGERNLGNALAALEPPLAASDREAIFGAVDLAAWRTALNLDDSAEAMGISGNQARKSMVKPSGPI